METIQRSGQFKLKLDSAEIICVGTELLLGEIVNTNAAFLAKRLAAIGICVYHQSVVGDNPERLANEYRQAFDRSRLVILTGGIGPTCDDLTKETVAGVLGLDMRTDDFSLKLIKDYFDATGRKMTENNIKQAMLPVGARAIRNDYGTAPGVIIESGNNVTVLLPGPPNELEPMFDEQVLPYLKSFCDHVIVSLSLNIMGMGESRIETILKKLMTESENPTVSPYAKFGEVRVRITAMADNEIKAHEMCLDVAEKIKATEVGGFIYGSDVEKIESELVRLFSEKGLTIATAESCTGGLIAKRITDIPGSSKVFRSGVVSYCNQIKEKVLGVSTDTIKLHTEVSAEAAKEMARGVRLLLGSDIGISSTGYAGPGGGTEENPVGTVYIGISTKNEDSFVKLSYSAMRDRVFIREAAASRAMLEAIKAVC